jgi:hypothetical protein
MGIDPDFADRAVDKGVDSIRTVAASLRRARGTPVRMIRATAAHGAWSSESSGRR